MSRCKQSSAPSVESPARMVGIRSQWRALPGGTTPRPDRSSTSWARRVCLSSRPRPRLHASPPTKACASENVDNRVTRRLQDVNKLALVEATELHYKAGSFRLDFKQKKVLDDVNQKLAEKPGVRTGDCHGSDQLAQLLPGRRRLKRRRALRVRTWMRRLIRPALDRPGAPECATSTTTEPTPIPPARALFMRRRSAWHAAMACARCPSARLSCRLRLLRRRRLAGGRVRRPSGPPGTGGAASRRRAGRGTGPGFASRAISERIRTI